MIEHTYSALTKMYSDTENTELVSPIDQSQAMNVYFGNGIVSIDLSDLSFSHDDLGESDISSILHESDMMDNFFCDDSYTFIQDTDDIKMQSKVAKDTSHRLKAACLQLDAICDWLQNEPTLYEKQHLEKPKSYLKNHIFAKCSMSSLPQNMWDSENNGSLQDHIPDRKQTTPKHQPSGKSSTKITHPLRQLLQNKMKKFRQLFRKSK